MSRPLANNRRPHHQREPHPDHMMAFSAIRARIREITRARHNHFLVPITTNQVLAAKSGTLQEEFAALCKIFGDADLATSVRQAEELAALRARLRNSRRRRRLSGRPARG